MKELAKMVVREPEYVIVLKLVVQPGEPVGEYQYRIRRGSRKVADVAMRGDKVRKVYDRKGRAAPVEDIQEMFNGSSVAGHTVVAFMVLRDAFDEKTAQDWYCAVSFMMPLPLSYSSTAKVYKRSDLFALILDAQQRKVHA